MGEEDGEWCDTVLQTEQKKPWNEQCIYIFLNEANEQENAKQFHL